MQTRSKVGSALGWIPGVVLACLTVAVTVAGNIEGLGKLVQPVVSEAQLRWSSPLLGALAAAMLFGPDNYRLRAKLGSTRWRSKVGVQERRVRECLEALGQVMNGYKRDWDMELFSYWLGRLQTECDGFDKLLEGGAFDARRIRLELPGDPTVQWKEAREAAIRAQALLQEAKDHIWMEAGNPQ